MAKRVRRSNVKDGVLLPLGNGFSLVKGDHPNKVDDVDIGPNNKNGLSVNHGEILQQKGNILRVFSTEPMLGGASPVQLLYGGMAPDIVFAMQERYKDIHGINDDGSRQNAQFGGDNIPMHIDSEGNLIDSIQPSVVTAKLPAKFKGSQVAATRYAEGYKFSKKIIQQQNEIAPEFIPFALGPFAPAALLAKSGGIIVDTVIQKATNNKRRGWSDAATFFLDNNDKKKSGEFVADFLNPGYLLGNIAGPIGSSYNILAKPNIGSKFKNISLNPLKTNIPGTNNFVDFNPVKWLNKRPYKKNSIPLGSKPDISDYISFVKHIPEYKKLFKTNPDIINNSEFLSNPIGTIQKYSKAYKKAGLSDGFYHGSNHKYIEEFYTPQNPFYKKNRGTTTGDVGIYFSKNPEQAWGYVRHKGVNPWENALPYEGRLYDVSLSLGKKATNDLFKNVLVHEANPEHIPLNFYENNILGKYDSILHRDFYHGKNNVVIFNPNRIKSNIGNNGDFNLNKSNIYK